MNDMYVGQSPTERGYDDPDEDPLVTENNRLTDRIAELTAEVEQSKMDTFAAREAYDMQSIRMAKLGEEVVRLRSSLSALCDATDRSSKPHITEANAVARNALKEG